MARFAHIFGLVAALAVLPLAVSAQSLYPGAKAPAIKVSGWTQGKPLTKFEEGKLTVVEFWATWCGPCKTSIPHLNELYEKNKDKVNVIGVSVWEVNRNVTADMVPEMVQKFVAEFGEKMTYNVAYDTTSTMSDTWMEAAKQRGIPTAFIVNDKGVVQWIGHPMSMDKPLEAMLGGSWNVDDAKKEFMTEMQKEAAMDAFMESMNTVREAYFAGEKEDAYKKLAAIETGDDPQLTDEKDAALTEFLARDKSEKLDTQVATLFKREGGGFVVALAAVSIAYDEEHKNAEAASSLVKKIADNEKIKDVLTLYYAGMAYMGVENYKGCITLLERALANADDEDPDFVEAIKQQLEAAKKKDGN